MPDIQRRAPQMPPTRYGLVLYDFDGEGHPELDVQYGQLVEIILRDVRNGWFLVQERSGNQGYVPMSYIEVLSPGEAARMVATAVAIPEAKAYFQAKANETD